MRVRAVLVTGHWDGGGPLSAVLRFTTTTRLVLSALLEDPAREVYGLQLMESTGLQSGTLYVILKRLQGHGWLTARWEERNAKAEGRPLRRYVKLTDEGVRQAREALERRRNRR